MATRIKPIDREVAMNTAAQPYCGRQV